MEAFIYIIWIAIFIFVIHRIQVNRAKLKKRKELRLIKKVELKRLSDCEDVVRYFANYHGYIARSVVSKNELEEMIEKGVTASELADFIAERILNSEGLNLGYQKIGDSSIPIILPNQFRDKHIYIIGKSGYGKTNFLRYLISQDLIAGHGLGVLAPEYEMLNDEILPFIPKDRIQDVIYFNPADLESPVVLNPLHINADDDIDLHVDETFTIFRRILGEGGPRMDEIFRHALYALVERPNTTLLDFAPLLDRHDSSFRNEIIQTTDDEQTRYFFEHTYTQLPKDSHIPIINRIGRIVRAKLVRNCICPPKNTDFSQQEVSSRLLNIRQAMDDGKILLFNLSDGILGEIASQLIGQLIVSKFQTATMSRADVTKTQRKPFYLYLDEFQNFCGSASKSYEKILSRARKYKLGMILAHQQTGQLPTDLLREILGNVSTLVSFQVSQADASKLSREFISQYNFEIESLPTEELLQLNIGQAYCKIGKSAFPFNIPKMSDNPDRERAEEVIFESRKQYGIPKFTKLNVPHKDNPDDYDDPLADIDPEGVFD
ncbi:MAG: type IV secretory system conjugative DNA transfer family protein [Methanosarcinaceae archaeon]